MRISDWSSDVCSSDLEQAADHGARAAPDPPRRSRRADQPRGPRAIRGVGRAPQDPDVGYRQRDARPNQRGRRERIGATEIRKERKRVVEGKRVTVRVDLGGHRKLTKKKQKD